MITLEEFKSLSLENKRDFLQELLLQILAEDGSQNGAFEELVFDSTEAELIEFFESITDDEKRQKYIEKLGKGMEEDNEKIIALYNQMEKETNKVKEYIEKQKEGETDDILKKIE